MSSSFIFGHLTVYAMSIQQHVLIFSRLPNMLFSNRDSSTEGICIIWWIHICKLLRICWKGISKGPSTMLNSLSTASCLNMKISTAGFQGNATLTSVVGAAVPAGVNVSFSFPAAKSVQVFPFLFCTTPQCLRQYLCKKEHRYKTKIPNFLVW